MTDDDAETAVPVKSHALRNMGYAALCTCLLMGVFLFWKSLPPECPPVIPNNERAKTSIEAAIRKELHKPTGEITAADLEKVKTISVIDDQVSDLAPFAKMPNLRILLLNYNLVTDLTPLTKLKKLEVIALHNNQVTDLTPLSEMTWLKSIVLGGNQIESLKPLFKLIPGRLGRRGKMLENISIDNNPKISLKEYRALKDKIPVDNFYSRGVPLSPGKLLNPGPMVDLTSEGWVWGSHLEGAHRAAGENTVFGMDETIDLEIRNPPARIPPELIPTPEDQAWMIDRAIRNEIRRLEVRLPSSTNLIRRNPNRPLTIVDFHSTKILTIRGITDMNPLSELINLESLTVGVPLVASPQGLETLTNLNLLCLTGGNISDLTPLSGLTNLVTLYLQQNKISDLTPLAGLTKLKVLQLDGNQISSLKGLRTTPLDRQPSCRLITLGGINQFAFGTFNWKQSYHKIRNLKNPKHSGQLQI